MLLRICCCSSCNTSGYVFRNVFRTVRHHRTKQGLLRPAIATPRLTRAVLRPLRRHPNLRCTATPNQRCTPPPNRNPITCVRCHPT